MNREEFIKQIDMRIKLIRNEFEYTQDKMAEVIGISKKTLIQVEKERASLGWTTAVAVSTIFKDSEILQITFGGEVQDIILSLAFNNYENNYKKTLGGKVWWNDIKTGVNFKIQQNIVSKHYRILDKDDRRICSSFELEHIENRLKELNKECDI
ncbi:MAG: helix-turn-helix transcriptional regulator [Clostridiaceae bacterium]